MQPTPINSALKNSPLSSIRRGKIAQPLRVVLAGVEGVGKSTMAANAPSPVFLAADSGTSHLDVARLPEPRIWDDVLDSLHALQSEKHEFKTFVADSLTWIEPILQAKVCADNKWANLEEPGYGKGFVAALDYWRVFVSELERLWRDRSMNIVLISHCAVKIFRNPEGEDFERYVLALNEKAAGLIKQWVDVVGFARHESYTKTDSKTKRVKAYSTGARVLHTKWEASFDAKNRYNLPEELPLSWDAFYDAVQSNGPERAGLLRQQIADGVKELGDPAVAKKVEEYLKDAGNDVARLAEIANAVAMKLGEKSEKAVVSTETGA